MIDETLLRGIAGYAGNPDNITISIDRDYMTFDTASIRRSVRIYVRENGVERVLDIDPDKVYDIDVSGDGVLLVAGENDVIEVTKRGFTDEKFQRLLHEVKLLMNSDSPVERSIGFRMFETILGVGM